MIQVSHRIWYSFIETQKILKSIGVEGYICMQSVYEIGIRLYARRGTMTVLVLGMIKFMMPKIVQGQEKSVNVGWLIVNL